jgi:copper chaperone
MGGDERRSYRVSGMSCEHCVAAVKHELGELAGVRDVEVDLTSGQVLLTGGGFDDEAVRQAVQSAGYDLAAAAA